MIGTKTTDPRERMGVFRSLDEVPPHYRLENHSSAFENRDVWSEYTDGLDVARKRRNLNNRVEDRWKSHMRDSSRHHALATPWDVENWVADMLDEMAIATVEDYWSRLRCFYDWMLWHAEYPHVYSPVLMAVHDGTASQQLWAFSMESNQ